MIGGGYELATILFRAPPFGWLGSLIIALSVAVALLAYTTGFRWRQHTQPTRLGLFALRLSAIVCLFLTLLHPACSSERTMLEKPIVALVLDDSASMSLPEGATEGQRGSTRYSRAAALLRDELVPTLSESHRLRLYDVEAHALRPEAIPEAAAGRRSPLTDTLLRVQHDLHHQPLAAVALLTDGAETTDRPALGGLGELHVPVHAIDLVGSSSGVSAGVDLSIQAVSTNRRVLVGNTVGVVVDAAAEGDLGEARLPVSVLEGSKLLASREIAWEPGRRVVRAELEFVPQRCGEFTYTVEVGAQAGEADLANNREMFSLTVRGEPLTVMYVDGVLRWEGKFIREALAADPDINVISTVRTVRVGADHGSQGLLLAEQLADVDVVILGDVEVTYFGGGEAHAASGEGELEALCTWVKDSGGGLLLTGGYRSFGPQGFGRSVLRDILPVELCGTGFQPVDSPVADQCHNERPFTLRLTDAGREHPIFRLTSDRVYDTAFFHKLPPLGGCNRLGGVKPGAEVLAVSSRIPGAGAEEGLPIMVVQQVGAGRTMVFAVDTTWRWRMVVGGFTGDSSFYQRFWGQLVRWLASEPEETPRRLYASTDQSRYGLGDTIELNIQLNIEPQDESSDLRTRPALEDGASAGWKVTALALDERGKETSLPLAELGEGRYRGTLAAAQPGRLDLFVAAEPLRKTEDEAAADAESRVITVQVARPDLEMRNPHPDPQWLARVVQLSGGRSVQPDRIQEWAGQLPADPVETTVRRTSGNWGDYLFGSAFLALMCAEWIVRRRSQLV